MPRRHSDLRDVGGIIIAVSLVGLLCGNENVLWLYCVGAMAVGVVLVFVGLFTD